MNFKYKLLLTCLLGLGLSGHGLKATAQDAGEVTMPTLVVTNQPLSIAAPSVDIELEPQIPDTPISPVALLSMPDEIDSRIYTKPVQLQNIEADKVLNPDYFDPIDTLTATRISDIQVQMMALREEITESALQLQTLETLGQDLAANYYAAVATINTQLQSGTTPGNPRLKARLALAEDALDILSGNVSDFNQMAVQVAGLASNVNVLQQEARAAYGLSGSVEEDHIQLAQLEDSLANTAVAIQRLLNNVNDNITRAAAYMASEQANLRTLGLAIANGDLYGKSLSNRPFSIAGSTDILNEVRNNSSMALAPMADIRVSDRPVQPRPLVKIRFDRPDVEFGQALYMSINEAMQKYPQTQFELVAVSPGMGNPAKLAIESTRARRNAEKVLRNMVQMGVDTNRVKLANLTQDDLQFNEVHLYIR
jgi:hypothetical protein